MESFALSHSSDDDSGACAERDRSGCHEDPPPARSGDRDGAAGESAAKAMGLASGVSCAPSPGEVDASSLCSPAGLVSALVALCALLLDPKTCPPVKRSTALTRPSGLADREGAALEDATVEVPGSRRILRCG